MTKYVVTVKKGTDINAFYNEMETAGGSSTIPDREVTCYDRRPISRNTGYDLEDGEREELLNDDRVLDVESQELLDSMITKPLWTQTSSDFDKEFIPTTNDKNWALFRCINGDTIVTWGSDNVPNAPGTRTIKTTSSGKNVDCLIVDGHLNLDHPEFAVNPDGSGGTRINQFNWLSLTSVVTGGANSNYVYRSGSALNNPDDNHGMHCAGNVAGNTQGWARDANIYYVSPYDNGVGGNQYLFEYILEWHQRKAINPATGRRNPTICNNSWGTFYQIDRGNVVSSTFRGQTSTNVPFSDIALQEVGILNFDEFNIYVTAYPSSLIADIQDCVDAGIIMVGAAGNSSEKIDVEGGIDYNNYITENAFDYYYHRGSWSTSASRFGPDGPGQRLSICVGAVSAFENERKTNFSCCGPRVDIYAPGDNIMSALNDGSVNGGTIPTTQDPRSSGFVNGKYDGTSMASPQTCGLIACLLENYPNMNQEDVRLYITERGKKEGQMYDSGTPSDPGLFTNDESLQGGPNYYSFYYKERQEEGELFPRTTYSVRNSETDGVKYPRTNTMVTKRS